MTPKKNPTTMEVFEALIAGNDPETGEQLSRDTVLNRSDVLRALIGGLDALQAVQTRAARRAQLPKSVGKPWTQEEEARMVSAYRDSEAIKDIAAKHQRTPRAIEARLEQLGILRPEDRRTTNSFVSTPTTKYRK